MAHVATHEAEVVHVDNWGGSRTRRGVLQPGGVGDKGEVNEHSGGRGMDCGRSIGGIGVNQTFISRVVVFPTSGAWVGAGLVLSFVFLLPFSSVRRDRDGMR